MNARLAATLQRPASPVRDFPELVKGSCPRLDAAPAHIWVIRPEAGGWQTITGRLEDRDYYRAKPGLIVREFVEVTGLSVRERLDVVIVGFACFAMGLALALLLRGVMG